MSAEDREAIAAAMNTIDGINCSPYFRQSTRPGDATVRLASREREDNGFGMVGIWQVWIVLPSDLVAAEKWMDDNNDAIYAALNKEMYVINALPSEIQTGASPVNGIIYEGSR